ncbi:cullin-1-like [Trifolium pratense]|uniref:cullin-1-like n=1 Tax=Trifolium pratense TaxID=57577 RepID=UPI001E697965|nr:cullin-1-like [Trifolium pratense]
MSNQSIVYYDEGWAYMQKGIKKLLQGLPNPHFTSEDSSMLYTNVYNMCTQNGPHDYSNELYEKYKETFKDYIKSTVLPSLREKKDELLLRDLLKRWSNHKMMIKYLSCFFGYLDIYFTQKRSRSSLEKVGYLSFYSLVGDEILLKCYTTIFHFS